jgi:recombination protein RecA
MAKEKQHKPPARIAVDKVAAAAQAVAELDKRYGDGTVMRLGDKVRSKHPCIPTGIYTIDHHVIQAGGVPRGRITEFYGPEAGGKTTLTLHTIAEAQALGDQAAFIDAEHALDTNYAEALGVDVGSLFVHQPDSGEQALEVAEHLIRSGAFGLVVVDSVAALVPQAELSGDMGDAHVGLQARLMSSALRKLVGAVAKTNTALVFINQLRMKIGVMYSNPETTPGGRALAFYASLRLDIRRTATNKIGDEAVSNTVRVKGAKNRIGSPFRETEVPIEFGHGFDKYGSIVEAGIRSGVIAQSGAWLTVAGERFQGRNNVIATLKDNPELYQTIYNALVEADSKEVAA